jgi:condensin complex subunit 3
LFNTSSPATQLKTSEEVQGSTEADTSSPDNNDKGNEDIVMEDEKSDYEDAVEAETAENSQVASIEENTDEDEDDEDEEHETLTSRFVESLLRHLFQGFADSKASIRIRCCQIIALSISSMGELE